MPAAANERLAAARAAVDQACQLLLNPLPEQMDRCTHLLESAVAGHLHRRNRKADRHIIEHANEHPCSLGQR